MIRQVSIVPTITVNNKKDYRLQAERINVFTRRVQIDVTDGIFTPNETLDITNIWWQKNWEAAAEMVKEYSEKKPQSEIAKISQAVFCADMSPVAAWLLSIFSEIKWREMNEVDL